jgi:hypothetical protein
MTRRRRRLEPRDPEAVHYAVRSAIFLMAVLEQACDDIPSGEDALSRNKWGYSFTVDCPLSNMANRLRPPQTEKMGPNDFISAGVAGLVGGITFAMLAVGVAPEQINKIALLYGLQVSPPLGSFIHLIHSFAIGIIYAWVVSFETVHEFATRVIPGVIIGLAFGIVLWVVAASFLMPVWLNAVTSRSPPVPDFDLVYFAGHVVYGIVLGAGYPLMLSRMPDAHGRPHQT